MSLHALLSKVKKRNDESIRWMHPSFRDLVINNLATSPKLRRDFLRNCQVPGVRLALSTAGGLQGERVRPLLVDDEDWTVLKATILRIAAVDRNAQTQILNIASEASESASDRMQFVLPDLLTLLRETWDRDRIPITLNLLSIYFALSIRTRPMAPAPDLTETWNDAWTDAQREFDRIRTDSDAGPDLVRYFIDLTRLIQLNEPRFLRLVGFPENYEVPFKMISSEFEKIYPLETEYESKSKFESAVQVSSDFEDFFECVGDLFVNCSDIAASARKTCRGQRRTFEQVLVDNYPDEENETSGSHITSSLGPTFNLESIFEDL